MSAFCGLPHSTQTLVSISYQSYLAYMQGSISSVHIVYIRISRPNIANVCMSVVLDGHKARYLSPSWRLFFCCFPLSETENSLVLPDIFIFHRFLSTD